MIHDNVHFTEKVIRTYSKIGRVAKDEIDYLNNSDLWIDDEDKVLMIPAFINQLIAASMCELIDVAYIASVVGGLDGGLKLEFDLNEQNTYLNELECLFACCFIPLFSERSLDSTRVRSVIDLHNDYYRRFYDDLIDSEGDVDFRIRDFYTQQCLRYALIFDCDQVLRIHEHLKLYTDQGEGDLKILIVRLLDMICCRADVCDIESLLLLFKIEWLNSYNRNDTGAGHTYLELLCVQLVCDKYRTGSFDAVSAVNSLKADSVVENIKTYLK